MSSPDRPLAAITTLWRRPQARAASSHAVAAALRGERPERRLQRAPHLLEQRGPDGMLHPDAIAEAYWDMHHQHRSAWTLELDVRPWSENF